MLAGAGLANLLRLLFAILILGGIGIFTWEALPASLGWQFSLAGAVGFGLGGFCMMRALKVLGSPRALLTVESLTAVLAGLFSWTFLDDRLEPLQVAFCLVALAGVLLAGSRWAVADISVRQKDRKWGYGYAAAAATFQAVSLVLSRGAFLEAHSLSVGVDKFNAALLRLAGGLLVALLLKVVLNRGSRDEPALEFSALFHRGPVLRQPLLWGFLNALSGPVLGVTCWLWAVSQLNPGLVQSIAATAPLISIPLSRGLEINRLGGRYYLGSLIAISAISGLVLC